MREGGHPSGVHTLHGERSPELARPGLVKCRLPAPQSPSPATARADGRAAHARFGEPEPASGWPRIGSIVTIHQVLRWGRPRACVFSGIWQYRDTTEALLFTTGFFSSVGARGKQRRVDGRSFARKNAAFLRSDCCRLGLFGDPALSSSSTLPHGWVARMRLACWSQMGSDSHR